MFLKHFVLFGKGKPEGEDNFAFCLHTAALALLNAVDGYRRNTSQTGKFSLTEELRLTDLLKTVLGFHENSIKILDIFAKFTAIKRIVKKFAKIAFNKFKKTSYI